MLHCVYQDDSVPKKIAKKSSNAVCQFTNAIFVKVIFTRRTFEAIKIISVKLLKSWGKATDAQFQDIF